MRSRKLLALLFCLITFPAIAGYMTLLGAGVGNISPTVSWVAGTDPFPDTSLTYSGPSLSTMFDSTGKLTYKPNNLLLQSNTFSNAVWVKSSLNVTSGAADPFGGTNAFTLTATGVSAEIYQSVTGNTSTNYVASIWVRRRTGSGSVNLYKPNDGSFTALAPSLTSNWQQFSTVGPGGASTAILDFVIQTSGDAVDVYAATLSAVTYETTPRTADQVITTSSVYYGPRIDYDPNTLAVKGLLIEPLPSTNYCPNSSTLTAWSATGGTLTNNSGGTLDPSGLNTASILNPSGGTTAGAFTSNITTSVSTEYTASYFVKSNGSNFAGIGFYDATNALLYVSIYNLTTGANTFTTGGVTPLTSENIGNGWWRISAKWTTAVNTVSVTPLIYTYSSGVGADPAATDKIYFLGPQYEKNFEAATYTPNPSTGTTTRAGDNAQFIGAAATAMSSSTFSAIAEASVKTVNAVGIFLVGANSAFGVPLYTTSSTTARAYDGVRASVYGNVNTGGNTWVSGSRAGISASPAGTTLAMAGGGTGTYTNFAGTPTGGALGRSTNSATNPGTIWFKSFAVYNQSLPDATLQAKSVVGASYAANDNGIRYAFADNDNLPIHWRVAL
jgi:hypothetical protein